MASLKLAATPGFLPSDGTVTIQFTEPEEATNVKITVFEADRWTVFGKDDSDGDGVERKRAEIFGTLHGRKFTRTDINTFITLVALDPVPPATKPTLITPGIMNLTVEHDGSQSLVPLQNIDKEKELGFFEIVFEVTATVGGTPMTYRTPTPVFVRNVPSGRAELAFIAGTEADFKEAYTKLFFPNAREYWKSLQDNRRDEIDLKSILGHIRVAPAASRGNAPWGTVNIVGHGSPDAWYMRMIAADAEPLSVTAGDLPSSELGELPGEDVLDEDSLVVLRGCEIGSNQPLLDAICKQFGGKASVYAPLHEMVYRKKGGNLVEVLFQKWQFDVPGKKPFPDDATLKERLKTKYATDQLYGSYTDADWSAVVAIHETKLTADALRQSDRWTLERVPAHDLDRKDVFEVGTNDRRSDLDLYLETSADRDKWNANQLEAAREKHRREVAEYEWAWKIRQYKNKAGEEKFELSGVGVKTVYQIFRLLTVTEDGKGPTATPDLHNPRHFGRSSRNDPQA